MMSMGPALHQRELPVLPTTRDVDIEDLGLGNIDGSSLGLRGKSSEL